MKKLMIALSALAMFVQTGFAKDVEHKISKRAENAAEQAATPANWTRATFTVCNKTSMPLFFIGWALNTYETKPYRWNDWVLSGECRTDKFDKYFSTTLYEFSSGPGQTPLLDYVLREGQTLTVTDSYIAKAIAQ